MASASLSTYRPIADPWAFATVGRSRSVNRSASTVTPDDTTAFAAVDVMFDRVSSPLALIGTGLLSAARAAVSVPSLKRVLMGVLPTAITFMRLVIVVDFTNAGAIKSRAILPYVTVWELLLTSIRFATAATVLSCSR